MDKSTHARLLDLEEAAWYMNTTERWIRDRYSRRELPAVKLGRAVRFRVEDLDRFIESNVVEAAD
jgi:excisionase family DNA binding protein